LPRKPPWGAGLMTSDFTIIPSNPLGVHVAPASPLLQAPCPWVPTTTRPSGDDARDLVSSSSRCRVTVHESPVRSARESPRQVVETKIEKLTKGTLRPATPRFQIPLRYPSSLGSSQHGFFGDGTGGHGSVQTRDPNALCGVSIPRCERHPTKLSIGNHFFQKRENLSLLEPDVCLEGLAQPRVLP
jgi:hypothetical protein